MSGSGRSAVRASSSVALLMRGTFTVPDWNTSPSTVIVARTVPGGDAGADVGAGERRRQRRAIRRARLTAGEIEQPIVVGARQRDRAGRPAILRERGGGTVRDAHESSETPSAWSFLSCWSCWPWLTSRSAACSWISSAGACASAVSSAATKNDGPMSGTVTWTGIVPADVLPMSLRNRSTSALALAASRSPPAWAAAGGRCGRQVPPASASLAAQRRAPGLLPGLGAEDAGCRARPESAASDGPPGPCGRRGDRRPATRRGPLPCRSTPACAGGRRARRRRSARLHPPVP